MPQILLNKFAKTSGAKTENVQGDNRGSNSGEATNGSGNSD
jgi:hypothetical protein